MSGEVMGDDLARKNALVALAHLFAAYERGDIRDGLLEAERVLRDQPQEGAGIAHCRIAWIIVALTEVSDGISAKAKVPGLSNAERPHLTKIG